MYVEHTETIIERRVHVQTAHTPPPAIYETLVKLAARRTLIPVPVTIENMNGTKFTLMARWRVVGESADETRDRTVEYLSRLVSELARLESAYEAYSQFKDKGLPTVLSEMLDAEVTA